MRSKDKGGRLVSWTARVVELPAGSEAWQAAVADLKGKRLNAPDGEAMTDRWAREVPGAAPGAHGGDGAAARRLAGRGTTAEPGDDARAGPGGGCRACC